MALLTDERTNKPSIWNQALKAVKGDTMNELVEQFTQEMTLVAEGLCEDQARLRRAVDGLIRETDGQRVRAEQDYQELLRQIAEGQNESKSRLDELSRRVAALEKPSARKEKTTLRSLFSKDLLGRLTLLVGMVCATWLAVSAMNILFALLN